MKKRKIGIILVLVGVGVLLLFFVFSTERYYQGRGRGGGHTVRNVDLFGLNFNYKYPLSVGGTIILVGAGMVAFSFIPKEREKQ